MAEQEGTDEIILDNGEDVEGITSDVDPANLETDDDTPEEKPEEKKDEPEKPSTDWDSDENPYKKRHGESVREVNENLLPKIKESEGKIAQIERERDEALSKLKDEKPEAYDNMTLQKSVATANRQIAELKEKVELDSFIAQTPDSASFRAALQQHARAFPNKSLSEIWEGSGFKEVAAGRAKAKTETTKRQHETKPEKGGRTAEPGKNLIAGKYTEAEFNKLSVAERGKILASLE